MNWTWNDIWKMIVSGSLLTTIVGFIAKERGFIVFKKKNLADVKKIDSETIVNLTEAQSKAIADQVSIADMALKWTAQMAQDRDKSNIIAEKRQGDIDKLNTIINTMRTEFEIHSAQVQDLLGNLQKELDFEKKRNKEQEEIYKIEIERLKKLVSEMPKMLLK